MGRNGSGKSNFFYGKCCVEKIITYIDILIVSLKKSTEGRDCFMNEGILHSQASNEHVRSNVNFVFITFGSP